MKKILFRVSEEPEGAFSILTFDCTYSDHYVLQTSKLSARKLKDVQDIAPNDQ